MFISQLLIKVKLKPYRFDSALTDNIFIILFTILYFVIFFCILHATVPITSNIACIANCHRILT